MEADQHFSAAPSDISNSKTKMPSRKSSTQLSIHLDNTNDTVQAGQYLTGTIQLHVHTEFIRANRLTLLFSGGEHTLLKYTKNRAQSYESLIHTNVPISRQFLWKEHSSRSDDKDAADSVNNNDDDSIRQGSYEIPFAFRLPANLPSSREIVHPWDCVNKCEIKYTLQAILEVVPSSCPCVFASLLVPFWTRTTRQGTPTCQRHKTQLKVIVKQPVPTMVESFHDNGASWNGSGLVILPAQQKESSSQSSSTSENEKKEDESFISSMTRDATLDNNDLAHRVFGRSNQAQNMRIQQRVRLLGASILVVDQEQQSSSVSTSSASPYHAVPGHRLSLEWVLQDNTSPFDIDSIRVSLHQSLKWNIKGPYLQYGSTQILWSQTVPVMKKVSGTLALSEGAIKEKGGRGGCTSSAAIHPAAEDDKSTPSSENGDDETTNAKQKVIVPFTIPEDCWSSYYNGTLMKIQHKVVIQARLSSSKKSSSSSAPAWMWKVRPIHIPLVVVEEVELPSTGDASSKD